MQLEAASGEISPVIDLLAMVCSSSTMAGHAYVDAFDACKKGGWKFPVGFQLHYFASLASHLASVDKIGEVIGMAYTDSVEVRALTQCGLQSDFINQFVSNTIQNLVLACANLVLARDKASSTAAGRDAIELLNAICTTVSDQEKATGWIPGGAKLGYEALRAFIDAEHASLDYLSEMCKLFGSKNANLQGVAPPGDLVSSWIVDGSRGRELVARAEAYTSSREEEIKLAQALSHARVSADSVRDYDIMSAKQLLNYVQEPLTAFERACAEVVEAASGLEKTNARKAKGSRQTMLSLAEVRLAVWAHAHSQVSS